MSPSATAATSSIVSNGFARKYASPIVKNNSTFTSTFTPTARATPALPNPTAKDADFAVPQLAAPGTAIQVDDILATGKYKDIIASQNQPVPRLFQPLTLRGVTFPNRTAVSPMCQYSSQNGKATDYHLVHYGKFALFGFGLTIVEATGVTPEGRISPYDMGLWSDDHIEPLARIVRYYHSIDAKIGIQIGHAGRKASTFAGHSSPSGRFQAASDADGGWEPVGPSAVPFNLVDHRQPREITLAEIADIKKAFVDAAKRADEADFDVLEIHGAHGYLISSFLSPNANKRTDHYGGSFENRTRLLLEIVEEVRANGVWPESKPLFVRVSANEWVEGGWTSEDTQRLAPLLYAAGVDLIDVSSGGINAAQQIPVKPQYQTPFSADLKRNVPGAVTGTVGMINEPEEAEEILQRDDADLILLGRNALREPQWPLRAARALGTVVEYPAQYGYVARHR